MGIGLELGEGTVGQSVGVRKVEDSMPCDLYLRGCEGGQRQRGFGIGGVIVLRRGCVGKVVGEGSGKEIDPIRFFVRFFQ